MRASLAMLFGFCSGVAVAAPDYRKYEAPDSEYKKLETPEHQRCLDKSGGVTASMRDCNGVEFTRLDRILNAEYRKAMSRLPSKGSKARLRALQREWLKSRWNGCYESAKEEEGGTLWLLVVDGCGIGEMMNRIVWLKQYSD